MAYKPSWRCLHPAPVCSAHWACKHDGQGERHALVCGIRQQRDIKLRINPTVIPIAWPSPPSEPRPACFPQIGQAASWAAPSRFPSAPPSCPLPLPLPLPLMMAAAVATAVAAAVQIVTARVRMDPLHLLGNFDRRHRPHCRFCHRHWVSLLARALLTRCPSTQASAWGLLPTAPSLCPALRPDIP